MSPYVSAPARTKIVLPVLTAIVAIAIFLVDTLTPLDIAVAVLYVAVVLLAVDFAEYRGILAIAAGCAALTLASFFLTHDFRSETGAVLRCFVSLAAIAITALLATRNQIAVAALREQADLLDLTHDTVFVRDRNDVIKYWNRAAESLYGWTADEAVGEPAAALLKKIFPVPYPAILEELEREGR